MSDTWQPIATAPKDGTHLLLYGEYIPNEPTIMFGPGEWIGFYIKSKGKWVEHGELDPIDVTHWMPLPQPPEKP